MMCKCEMHLSCDERKEVMEMSEMLWLESLQIVSDTVKSQTKSSKEAKRNEC